MIAGPASSGTPKRPLSSQPAGSGQRSCIAGISRRRNQPCPRQSGYVDSANPPEGGLLLPFGCISTLPQPIYHAYGSGGNSAIGGGSQAGSSGNRLPGRPEAVRQVRGSTRQTLHSPDSVLTRSIRSITILFLRKVNFTGTTARSPVTDSGKSTVYLASWSCSQV